MDGRARLACQRRWEYNFGAGELAGRPGVLMTRGMWAPPRFMGIAGRCLAEVYLLDGSPSHHATEPVGAHRRRNGETE